MINVIPMVNMITHGKCDSNGKCDSMVNMIHMVKVIPMVNVSLQRKPYLFNAKINLLFIFSWDISCTQNCHFYLGIFPTTAGTRDVIVILLGNGHGKASSNPE